MESIVRFDTYLLWEVGKPADFALEIGSPSTARNDLMSKRALYARPGIGEYWRHDKTGGNFYGEPLVGKYLEDGEYQRLEMHREANGTVWAHSPTLNPDLCWDEGRLRYYDPTETRWLLNQEEEQASRQEAEAARQAEAARLAEAARQGAEAARRLAESRVSGLEAELHRLRGE